MPINDDAYLPYFCFNDIIFPVKTKSFQTIIQGF